MATKDAEIGNVTLEDLAERLVEKHIAPALAELKKAVAARKVQEVTDDMVDNALALYVARSNMSPRDAMRQVLETYLLPTQVITER